jgi:hypothetical protein
MSVDFEFRNKKRMWSRNGTPTFSMIKKLFESGRVRGTKVVPLPKENRLFPVAAFSIDCGGDCWLHVYDTGKYPTIKMSHFDHIERAVDVLQKAAAIFDCVVLNDLDHGDSEIWAGKPKSKKIMVGKSSFGINIKPINISFGLKKARK